MGNSRIDEVPSSSDKARPEDLTGKLAAGGLLELVGTEKKANAASGFWVLDNVIDPFVDGSVRMPVRSVAVAAQSIGLNVPTPEVHRATGDGVAGTAQMVSYMAGSMVPYLIAGRLAGSGLKSVSKGFLAEGTAAKILTSEAAAQITGAVAYDFLRAPEKNETRLTNAMAGGVAFSAYEAGGLLTARYGISPSAIRAAAGFVGGAGYKLTASLGSPEPVTAKEVLDAGLAGAAFNVLLPKGQELVSRASNHISYLRLPTELRQYIKNPGETGQTHYIGWLGHQNKELAVAGTRGVSIENAVPVKFSDLTLAQRKALVVDVTRRGAGPLANPETAASFANALTGAGKGWTDLTKLSREADQKFMVVADLITEAKIKSIPTDKPSKELAEAVLNYRGLEKGLEAQRLARGAELETSLNKWTTENGLPGAKLIVEDSWSGIAAYAPGTGTMKVDTEVFNQPFVTAKLADNIAHEYTHLLQDVLHIRRFADKLGVGTQATAQQKSQIQDLFKTTYDMPLSESFLDDVLRLRDGRSLTFWEGLRERNLGTARLTLRNDGTKSSSSFSEDVLCDFASATESIAAGRPWDQSLLKTTGGLLRLLRQEKGEPPPFPYTGPRGSAPEMFSNISNQLGQVGERLNLLPGPAGNSLFIETSKKFEPLLYTVQRKAHVRYMLAQHEQEAHATGFLTALSSEAFSNANKARMGQPTVPTGFRREGVISFLTHP